MQLKFLRILQGTVQVLSSGTLLKSSFAIHRKRAREFDLTKATRDGALLEHSQKLV